MSEQLFALLDNARKNNRNVWESLHSSLRNAYWKLAFRKAFLK